MYREHWGTVVARLTRRYGPGRLSEIEAATQDAFLAVHERGTVPPERPLAWLVTTASNRLIDVLRKEQGHAAKEAEVRRHHFAEPEYSTVTALTGEVRDDLLRMLFVCCHPALGDDARVPLTLKSLCGFRIPELAKTFLVSEDAIDKRLVRARKVLREEGVSFTLPTGEPLEERLDAVLKVLYLVFNEGYSGHSGATVIRANLCEEAIRLTSELSQNAALAKPRIWALLAMFLLSSARLPARLDREGALVDLASQDRSKWDRQRIQAGFAFLKRSARGEQLSSYHLEAMIAGCHARAPSHAETDWKQIRTLYEQLHHLVPSPVIRLQAAIAVGYAESAAAALVEIRALASDPFMKRFYLYYAALAEFSAQTGDTETARVSFERALALTEMPAEKAALRKKLHGLGS